MEELIGYNLSPQQRRFWWLTGRGAQLCAQVVVTCVGPLDKILLHEAIRQVINKDTIFRTTYPYVAELESQVQLVNDEALFEFSDEVFASPQEAVALQERELDREFDFEHGPLLRVVLASMLDGQHLLTLTLPSICADTSSLSALVAQIAEGYRLLSEGSDVIQFDNLQYIQFSEWQNQLLESDEAEEGKRFWKTRAAAITPAPALPFDLDPLHVANVDRAFFRFDLDAVRADKVRDSLRDTEFTTEQFLAASWLMTLGRLTNSSSLTVGHFDTCRSFDELANTFGLLSRCLPLPFALDNTATFGEGLLVYGRLLAENQEFNAYYLSEETATHHVGVAEPLRYAFEMSSGDAICVAGETSFIITDRRSVTEVSKLKLTCQEQSRAIVCDMQYNARAFSPESIEYIAHAFLAVVEQCAGDHDVSQNGLSLLDEFYMRRLLDEFTGHAKPFAGADKTVIDLFEEQAERFPGKVAVVCAERRLTYQQLNERASIIASRLRREMGVAPGALVGLMCGENENLIAGMLGILKAGGAYVPLDPNNPHERTAFILADSALETLVTETRLLPRVEGYAGHTYCLDTNEPPFTPAMPGRAPARAPDDVAYVIYTSGTTGQPKGTLIPNRSLVNYVNWASDAFALTEEDSSILLASYAFDLGYTSIWGTLLNGGCLHLVPADLVREPSELITYLVKAGISFIKITPSLCHLIVNAITADELGRSELRLIVLGGEQIRVDDLERLIRLKPDVALVNHYGPTETTIGTIAHPIDTARLETYRVHPVIGKPIANNTVYILDDQRRLVAPGIEGELYVAGAGVANGYLGRDKLTKEKFVADTFTTGRPMYRTGDLARWMPDGAILFTGRRDDQVKIRGYRVELEEVQSTLLKHDQVREAVVVAVDSDEFGRELAAYFVGDDEVELESLIGFMSARLPAYMLPGYFVPLAALPLTPNGKLDKRALPDPRGFALGMRSANYVAPRTEMERRLAEIWEEVLGRKPIGMTDDFFELGGHSLKAIQLISRMHKELNIKLELGEIFSHTTIEALSQLTCAEEPTQFREIDRLPEQPFYDVSHAQRRLLVLSQFDDGSVAYNVAGYCVLEGVLDTEAFRRSFNTVIERHESLRTVFIEVDGEPKQKILDAGVIGFALVIEDLRNDAEAEAHIKQIARTEATLPFDLVSGPLLRVKLLRTSGDTHVLLFSIHHIISDGWSRGVLLREVLTHYAAYIAGQSNPLPPLRIQYKDYAAWHNSAYDAQGAYWNEIYGAGVPSLDFPLDHERPKVLSFVGEMIQRVLPVELSDKLRNLADDNNTTLNNLFLSLYSILLSKYTGQNDLVIGSLVSGRNYSELENLIGIFINFLPLRFSPQDESTLPEFLHASHHKIIRAYENQDFPFDVLVDTYIRERDISRNPFFDTMVVYHSEGDIEGSLPASSDDLYGSSIRIRPYEVDTTNTTLDFKLDVRPGASTRAFYLYLSYNRNLFERASIEMLLDKFVALIEQVVASPVRQVGDYSLFTPDEKSLLLEKMAATNHLNIKSATAVNICASFVLEPVEEYLDYWGREFELNLKVSFAPYNQVFQHLLDTSSNLRRNDGINVLFLRVEDWLRDLKGLDETRQLSHLEKTYDELTELLQRTSETSAAPYLVGVVPVSPHHSFAPTVATGIHRLSDSLRALIEKIQGFHPLDLEWIAELYAVEVMFDAHTDAAGHMPFTPECYAAIGTYLARKIHSWQMPPFKVIALDCDNTLWKGICGEVGVDGVIVDQDCLDLQRFLLKKYDEGFLLALCSKNNPDDVWNVFDHHPEMILRREKIVAHRINWQPKSTNLGALAEELNVGADSIIFIDDSPFELEEVAAGRPEVLGLCLPEEAGGFKDFLNHIWAFDRFKITREDKKRNDMYRAEQQRQEDRSTSAARDDFYQSLDIQITIAPVTVETLERSVQLLQRTNQFNLNGIRLTAAQLRTRMETEGALNWTIEVKDRFGEYGLVGLVLAEVQQCKLIIEAFLLSCRVLGRGVEDAILTELQQYCHASGLSTIEAHFRQTERNSPFSQFLAKTAWRINDSGSAYCLVVSDQVATTNYTVVDQ